MKVLHDDQPKKKLNASHVYRDLRDLVWPRRRLFLAGLALVFINRVASLVLPGSTKFLIDDVVQKHRQELLMPLAAAVGVSVLIQAVTSYTLIQLLSTSAQRLIADMRVRVQEHIGRLPVRYYDGNKTGALVSRIMSDVEGVRNLVGTGLVEFIGGMFTAVIAFGLVLKINATLTFVALAFLLIFGVILRKAFRSIRPIFRERGKINAEVTGRLTESLGGVRIVKGFHAEAREAEVFGGGVKRLLDNVLRSLTAVSLMSLSATVLMGIVGAIVMFVGTHRIFAGTLTLGEFVTFTAFLAFLIAPVFQVVGIGTQLTEAFAGLERTREVLRARPEDRDPNRTLALGSINGDVVFDDVSFSYEAGKEVLHDVSF